MTDRYARRRMALIDLLRERGLTDERVLDAVARVPRHEFVDQALHVRAYRDEALPIGLKQTISQPSTVAAQTILVNPQPGERILEIGTGSGFQAAVLAELGADVYSIERHEPLHTRTADLLERLGYAMHLRWGDGTLGWPEAAPFDAVLVTAGGTAVPRPLMEQLKVGGRLIIPVGETGGEQTMLRIVRTGATTFDETEAGAFRFVPLIGDGLND